MRWEIVPYVAGNVEGAAVLVSIDIICTSIVAAILVSKNWKEPLISSHFPSKSGMQSAKRNTGTVGSRCQVAHLHPSALKHDQLLSYNR
jgi:hypothetical protein